jgi:phosphoglycerate dehydrogenase-like enzyme
MESHTVLITTNYLEPDGEIRRVLERAGCAVTFSRPQDRGGDQGHLRSALRGARAVIVGTEPFRADLIDCAPDLGLIARTGVGYDNVDLHAAAGRGIKVCVTPGVNRQSVAELTLGLLIDAARGIVTSERSVRAGSWTQCSGRELGGSTLGLVGLGAIGQAVATMARGIGMHVLAHDTEPDGAFVMDRGIELCDLGDLLRRSDFVSIHVALTPASKGMIGRTALATMKPGSYLVNTARGGIVDEVALAGALCKGHLGGAALDVLETEPLPADHPLRSAPNVTITPHIAGATTEARTRSSKMAASQIIDFFEGRPVAHLVPGASR